MIFKLWKNSSKHILYIVFGIAVITCFMFSLFEMGEFCLNTYEELLLNTDRYDYAIHDLSAGQFEEIEKACIENNVEEYFYFQEAVSVYPQNFTQSFSLGGISGNIDKILDVEEGRIPEGKNELCIVKNANDSLPKPYAVGDTIYFNKKLDEFGFERLEISEEPMGTSSSEGYRIVGIVDFYLTGGYIFYLNEYPVFEYPIINSRESDSSSHIRVLASSEGYGKNGVVEEVNPLLDYIYRYVREQGIKINDILSWNDNRLNLYSEEGGYRSVSNGIKSLNIIIILCSLIFLSGELYNLFLSRENTYRILRCIGCPIKKIELMMLQEMLMLGSAGMVMGFLLGSFINKRVVIDVLSGYFDEIFQMKYRVNIKSILICVSIIICTILFSVLILHISIRKTQPLENNMGSVPYRRKEGKKNGSALEEYKKKEGKLNNMFSILQFAVILFSFVLSIMVASVIDGYGRQNFPLDKKIPLRIRVGADAQKNFISPEEIEEVGKMEGVLGAYGEFYGGDLYAMVGEKKVWVAVYSDELSKAAGVNWPDGDYCLYVGNEPLEGEVKLIATDYFIEHCSGMKKSTSIKIKSIPKEKAVYFANQYEDGLIIIREGARNTGLLPDIYNTVCIRADKDVEELKAKVEKYFGGADKVFTDDNSMRARGQRQIKGMITLASYILVILLLTVISVITLSYQHRYTRQSKDLGIMRALGMSEERTAVLFCMGSLSVTIKAVIIGSIISFPVVIMILDIFFEITSINPVVYLITILVYLLYIMVYGLFMFRFLKGNKIIREQAGNAD